MAVAAVVAGAALTAYSQSQEGEAARAAGKATARQQERNAKASLAEGTRRSIEIRRQGARTASDAEAIMGMSGGVTDDVGAIKTLADIEQVTNYNALASLYESRQQSDRQNFAAQLQRMSGQAARTAGNVKAAGTVLSGASSAYTMGKK